MNKHDYFVKASPQHPSKIMIGGIFSGISMQELTEAFSPIQAIIDTKEPKLTIDLVTLEYMDNKTLDGLKQLIADVLKQKTLIHIIYDSTNPEVRTLLVQEEGFSQNITLTDTKGSFDLREYLSKDKFLTSKVTDEETAILAFDPQTLGQIDELKNSELLHDTTSISIFGPTGSGKEQVWKFIQKESTRKGLKLVINMSRQDELLRDDLFGHTKGGYTSADSDRIGCIEAADGGILFCDEIANLSMDLQGQLLRILEDQVVSPIGGGPSKKVDVKFVFATNKDLMQAVEDGTFRLDLYHRITGHVLTLKPLVALKKYIHKYLTYFLNFYASKKGLTQLGIHYDVFRYFQDYVWSGNLREMASLVQKAISHSRTGLITLEDFSNDFNESQTNEELPGHLINLNDVLLDHDYNLKHAIKYLKNQLILLQLEQENYNKRETAKKLKIAESSLFNLIKPT